MNQGMGIIVGRPSTVLERLFAGAGQGVVVLDMLGPEARVVWANARFCALMDTPLCHLQDVPLPRALEHRANAVECRAVLRLITEGGSGRVRVRVTSPAGDVPGECLVAAVPQARGVAGLGVGCVVEGSGDAVTAGLARAMAGHLDILREHQREVLGARMLDGDVALAVLQTIRSGVLATSEDGTLVFVNRAAQALLGRGVQELLGRSIRMLMDADAISRWYEPETPPGEHRFDLPLLSTTGERLELGVTLVKLDEERSSGITHIYVFRNVGEWRLHEQELRRIKGLNALGQMAAGFAHEVRNPLAALRAMAESLRQEPELAPGLVEYPERMVGLVTRLEKLVRSALRFGRPRPPSAQALHPGDLLREVEELLRPRLGAGRLQVVLEQELPTVHVDEGQAVEVLLNIVENALDATGDAARVTIRATRDDAHVPGTPMVRMEVADDGPGIPAQSLESIFDPFWTTKAQGTGLGLAISQRLVSENRGHLWATSTPGVRTVFTVLWPVEAAPGAPVDGGDARVGALEMPRHVAGHGRG